MSVRKPCRNQGCKTSPRCDHSWWLDVMHRGARIRMPVDDFALPRGATAPVTTKQEAEKLWEPKFIAEIVAGRDTHVAPERETATTDGPASVAELLDVYRTRYVEVEPLKSRPTILSRLNVLASALGEVRAQALC